MCLRSFSGECIRHAGYELTAGDAAANFDLGGGIQNQEYPMIRSGGK